MSLNVEQTVRDNITRTVHMSVATVADNAPWVCEVHFAYDDNLNLYFSSLESRRHSQEIAENAKVAGNIIDKYELGQAPIGVYYEGEARLLEAGDERDVAFQCFKDQLGAKDTMVGEADREGGHKIYKITVANWYVFGRFDQPKGQKYKLEWNGGATV